MIVNISRKQINEALKFAGGSDTRFILNGLSIQASGKNTIIRATDGHRLMMDISNQEGKYPDCNAVVEPVLSEGVKIHIQDKHVFMRRLEDILTMGKLISKRARTFKTTVKFKFTKTKIVMTGPENSIVRSVSCDIPSVLVGKKMGFNASYLYDAMAHVSGVQADGIEFYIQANLESVYSKYNCLIGPLVLKPYGKDFPLHAVMSMRIN